MLVVDGTLLSWCSLDGWTRWFCDEVDEQVIKLRYWR